MIEPCPHCHELAAANRAVLESQRGVDRAAATTIDALLTTLKVTQDTIDILRDTLEKMRATLRREPNPEPEPITAH